MSVDDRTMRGDDPVWDRLAEIDPEFLDRYDEIASHPMDGPLDEKTAELVALASHAACTTLYEPGIRRHVGRAFDAGATVDEVMDVIEMISAIGVHAVTEGVPVLVDEAGLPEDAVEAELEKQEQLRDEFEAERGYWDELWDQVLRIDHEYFEHYLNYSAHPFKSGPLDPMVREFVIIAADASTNHLYLPGLRIHIRNALGHGATREQVMAVIEIASVIGINTVTESLPIVLEEAAARDMLPDDVEK
ncbi:carboxymuconolactone decarboxylase family protein [Natronosalvus halobius]|uniref:carboxymuconolactone decarboxylase family protein n=1 Tax=Natronosalvus halobius TaxID=2953746 RepID=UPI00209D53FD|nr:carboxymuconolactone decarboxylase family protein [Natronosalvus halobius]USZ73606.1 carboxymuconolactone decarboxylase family protein [Natronosalvus halobius]